jgi:TRAP-type C4-dicarboxylate transport system substrate-binding protein
LAILTREFGHSVGVADPVAFLTAKGMTVTFLTPEERAAFRQATRPVYDQWVPVIGQTVYQAALIDLGR